VNSINISHLATKSVSQFIYTKIPFFSPILHPMTPYSVSLDDLLFAIDNPFSFNISTAF
jgi:hypothetical protein